MKNLTMLIVSGVLIFGSSACSTAPESDPAYVSPMQYQSYNCNQIHAEMRRISTRMEQTSANNATSNVLNTALAAYAISQGYGVSGGDNNIELTRLQNQYSVLEQTAIQKECNS